MSNMTQTSHKHTSSGFSLITNNAKYIHLRLWCALRIGTESLLKLISYYQTIDIIILLCKDKISCSPSLAVYMSSSE